MRASLLAAISVIVLSPSATADGMSLASSLWQCTRAIDQSQFLITLYTGGGMGGGELESGEVSSYIFDASRTKPGEWPAKREQTDQRFTWAFPDQSMRVEGNLQRANQPAARLTGTETSPGGRTAVICTSLAKLPKIGEGFVIPQDSRFIDLDGEEGELQVPAGISLQPEEP